MLELGVEGLGHRHKRDAVGIEQLDELGEISERAGQPVDLVNQHNVNPARPAHNFLGFVQLACLVILFKRF